MKKSLLIFLIFWGCSAAFAQYPPLATFTASPDPACANNVVTFTDQSSDAPTSWSWAFGDGSTSTLQNPTYMYYNAGNYSVVLIVSNAFGSDTLVKPIVVNSSPLANAGPDQTISAGGSAQIGVAPDTTFSYLWSNGATTAITSVSPTTTTTYTLTVTKNGCSSTDAVVVTVGSSITALIQTQTNVSCYGGNDGAATVVASGGTGTYTYAWNTTPAQTTATATGLPAGAYSVTVTDSNSQTATATVTITQPMMLTTTNTFTDASCGASNGTVNTVSSGGTPPYTYTWSSGQTTQNISNLTAGVYTVTVSDSQTCTYSSQAIVNNTNGPTVSAGADHTVASGVMDSLHAIVSGGISPYTYVWTGGGTSATIVIYPTVTTTYTVTVTDYNGCVGTDAVIVTVSAGGSAPVANFTTSGTNGCIGIPINFTDQSTNAPTSWTWNLGDGVTSFLQNPVHAYNNTGVYTISLTVTNAFGSNTKTNTSYITINSVPIANAGADQNISEGGQAQIGTAPDSLSSYLWSNGSTTASITVSPSVTTTFTVTVTNQNGCSATDDVIVTVTQAEPCSASFGYENFPDSLGNINLMFYSTSQGNNLSYFWDFGDGSSNTQGYNVNHNFVDPGYHVVCLTVSTASGLCMSDTCMAILSGDTVGACNADFTFAKSSGNTMIFNSSTSNGLITGVIWNFGDGGISVTRNPAYTYPASAYFNVTLTVNDSVNNCLSSITKTIEAGTTNNDCQADFNWTAGTVDNNISFVDNSLGSGLNNYLWNFGDGEFANTQDTAYEYTTSGFYLACLTVWSTATGCHNTKCIDVQAGVNAHSCQAEFDYVSDSTSAKTKAATSRFKGTAIGSPTKSGWDILWEFGDGTSNSTLWEPEHTYADTGLYLVHFRISSSYCSDDFYRLINAGSDNSQLNGAFGHVETPGKKSGTQGSDFKGTAIGDPSSISWDFGDDSPIDSTTWEPYHEFPADSTFIVCMTVADPITGQEDTYCETIHTTNGIATNDFEKPKISLFPNPASKMLYVNIMLNTPETVAFELLDVSGRSIEIYGTDKKSTGGYIKEIPVQNLIEGFYFIKVKTKKSTLYLKFVKN